MTDKKCENCTHYYDGKKMCLYHQKTNPQLCEDFRYSDEFFDNNWEYWMKLVFYCRDECKHNYSKDEDSGSCTINCALTGYGKNHRWGSNYDLIRQCPILKEIEKEVQE